MRKLIMQAITSQKFEVFHKVAELGSITEAAKQLHVSKAAVSHSIKQLEATLEIPLFIRSTRKITLTDEGKLLYTQCQRLKDELDITRNLISNFTAEPSGTLRISCNPYLADTLLLPILSKYIKQYPAVNIEVFAEERMPNMFKENIDIVFGINWPAPDEVVAREIGKTRYVLCASPQYLENHGTPTTLKELEKHTYIPHLGRNDENIIANLKQKISLNLNTQLKVNNALLMKRFALNGFGITQLHDYMVNDEIRSRQLVEVLKDTMKTTIPLYIYYQKHRFVQPKIRQFVSLVTTDAKSS